MCVCVCVGEGVSERVLVMGGLTRRVPDFHMWKRRCRREVEGRCER